MEEKTSKDIARCNSKSMSIKYGESNSFVGMLVRPNMTQSRLPLLHEVEECILQQEKGCWILSTLALQPSILECWIGGFDSFPLFLSSRFLLRHLEICGLLLAKTLGGCWIY